LIRKEKQGAKIIVSCVAQLTWRERRRERARSVFLAFLQRNPDKLRESECFMRLIGFASPSSSLGEVSARENFSYRAYMNALPGTVPSVSLLLLLLSFPLSPTRRALSADKCRLTSSSRRCVPRIGSPLLFGIAKENRVEILDHCARDNRQSGRIRETFLRNWLCRS